MMQGIHKTEDFNSTINSNHPVIIKFEAIGVLIVKQWICGLILLLRNIITIAGTS